MKKHQNICQFAVEYVPIILFFAGYFWKNLFFATMILVGATAILSLLYFILFGRISTQALVTLAVVGVFGGLTLFFKDERFIKMKPTVIQVVFALILWGGLIKDRLFLKSIARTLYMEDLYWRILTKRFVVFFFFGALVNEVVWRTQTTEFWVVYKVFGSLGLMFVFMLFQYPFLSKHARPSGEEVPQQDQKE